MAENETKKKEDGIKDDERKRNKKMAYTTHACRQTHW
jgi:hypothetical protein